MIPRFARSDLAALVALALFAAGCATTPQSPDPASLPTPTRAASRVVLLSFDGLGADALRDFPSPAFARLPLRVDRVIPVEPSATTPTHAAILTGATPQHTGIVSNVFHKRGRPVREAARGIEEEIQAETLIDAARSAGKRVGSIAFPTVDSTSPRRRADFGMPWTRALVSARIVSLSRADFRPEWLPAGWTLPARQRASFSPVMRARLEWQVPGVVRTDVDLVAYDTTDDVTANYDALRVEVDGVELPQHSDGWFAVQRQVSGGLVGSWSKVLRHDISLSSVTLYWGAVSRSEVYPETFRLTVEGRAGFWPGLPDEEAVRNRLRGGEGLSTADFLSQAKRLSDYLTRAALAAIETMPFDLLLAYQPAIDQTEHQFLMTLPTQLHATPANRAEAAAARAEAFRIFDGAVAAMTSSIDSERDALVVTGDHGVAPVELEVRINTVLTEQGYAKAEGSWLSESTRWAAYATGQVAHLYRFHAPDDSDAVVRLLTDLRTSDGAPVFERVATRDKNAHPHSGDIVAYAWPRFALSMALGERFARPLYYGQHGALNTHRQLDTVLAAGGAGVAAGRIPQTRQTAVAAYVAALLGIEPPRNVLSGGRRPPHRPPGRRRSRQHEAAPGSARQR